MFVAVVLTGFPLMSNLVVQAKFLLPLCTPITNELVTRPLGTVTVLTPIERIISPSLICSFHSIVGAQLPRNSMLHVRLVRPSTELSLQTGSPPVAQILHRQIEYIEHGTDLRTFLAFTCNFTFHLKALISP